MGGEDVQMRVTDTLLGTEKAVKPYEGPTVND